MRKEQGLIQKARMEELQQVEKQKRQNRELVLRRKKNRSREQSKIDEAAREYMQNRNSPCSEADYGMGAVYTLPVEGVEMELTAEAVKLLEAQLEQQEEMSGEDALSGTGGSGGAARPSWTAGTGGGTLFGAAGASAGGMDITV